MLDMLTNLQTLTAVIYDVVVAFKPIIVPLYAACSTIVNGWQFGINSALRNDLAKTRHKLATANAALSYARAISPDAERAVDFIYDYHNGAASIELNFPEWPAYHKDYVEMDMGSYA